VGFIAMKRMRDGLHEAAGPARKLLLRELRIAEPCVGLGGCTESLTAAAIDHVAENVFDIDAQLEAFYVALDAATPGPAKHSHYKLGPGSGDILAVQDSELAPSEGLVSGPPCTPWAGSGRRQGQGDPRSKAFETLIVWTIRLAHRGGLLFVALENSPNAAARLRGETSFIDVALGRLRAEVPYFVWDYVFVQLEKFLPHSRERLFLRGMRLDTLERNSIPAPLSALPGGSVQLVEILEDDAPNIDSASLTSLQKENLKYYERRVVEDAKAGKAGTVAAMELHRKAGGSFRPVLVYDKVPALQAQCNSTFVIRVEEAVAEVPVAERTIFRLITARERFMLQGHDPSLAAHTPSGRCATRLTGNAFAVPMVGAVVIPMIEQIARSGVIEESGVIPLSKDSLFRLAMRGIVLSDLPTVGDCVDEARRVAKRMHASMSLADMGGASGSGREPSESPSSYPPVLKRTKTV
jgi:site-specific DNA-cytosine methylase